MARRGDSRSPSPLGSPSTSRRHRGGDDKAGRSRREHGKSGRRSRSPDRDRNPHDRDRDANRKQYRSRERRDYRQDDRAGRSRRERSRDRSRSLGHLNGRDRRNRSRERIQRDKGGEARDRHKRKRDDSLDSPRDRKRKDDRGSSHGGFTPESTNREPSKPVEPAKQTEEEKKAERLAKLNAWKQKHAAQKEQKEKEYEQKGGARNLLAEMDKKANEESNTEFPVAIPDTLHAKKFDPKQIARKANTANAASSALGGDIQVPQHLQPPAKQSSTASHSAGSNDKPSFPKASTASGSLKAKDHVSGFGLGGRPNQNESEKGLAKKGLDFDDEQSTRKKLEKLPTPPLDDQSNEDAALANGEEEDEDHGVYEDLVDGEEADAAAARAAAEKREERMNMDRQETGNDQDRGEAQSGAAAVDIPTHGQKDVNMTDAPDGEGGEGDLDPLDAFMSGLDQKPRGKAPGLSSATSSKKQEPQAMFNDEDDEFTAIDANADDFLDMASKSKKKKEIPTVNHAKMNYLPFRKSFYTEPLEVAQMSPEELANLRLELDGIKVKGVDAPKPVQKWSQFGLGVPSLEVIRRLGFDQPTAIQAQAIPAIMSGRDVTGIAKTGSGKTIAFLLPMFRHIKDQRPLESLDGPIGLVLTPTRELCTQIHKECKPWLKALNLRAVSAYGGAPIKDQIAELKRGAEIVVCTPGRMIDLLAANAGRVTNLRRVTYTVLDEADRMFDMGFEPQVMKILANVRPQRQTVLFSATFPRNMEALARKTQSKPVEIVVGGRSVVAPEIKQVVEVRSEETKFVRLLQLLGEVHEDEDARTLVFVERQESAEELMNAILRKGYPCFTIHGGKDQYDRDSVISDFKAGIFPVLVATSVAARGLDVKQLKMVVNYDCPNHLEDYVHRSGRTGRAGNEGLAVTFVTPEQGRYSIDVAKALKQSKQEIPSEIQNLVDTTLSNIKSGKEKGASYGFGGKGLEHVDAKHEAARARERGQYKTGDEPEEEKDQKDKKEEDKKAKPEAAAPEKPLKGVPEGIDLDGKIQVHKTEAPPPNANSQDRMKGVSDAVAAINARLRKSGDIRGNAPIDNKGPDAGAYHATLEINDFPQKARWAVTNRTNVAKILEATGTSITTKGNFYGTGQTPGPSDAPKLYILVEGDTEVVVTNAMRELMRLLKQGTIAAENSESRAPTGRYTVV
ncbi:MAG: pre-mRNA processing RNA-helicase [Alyxoria varia]|nr:MAG: pre-mRNA processing RNA-helicase [Alyxoria varia]